MYLRISGKLQCRWHAEPKHYEKLVRINESLNRTANKIFHSSCKTGSILISKNEDGM